MTELPRRPLARMEKRRPWTLWATDTERAMVREEALARGFEESPFAVKLMLHGLKYLQLESVHEAPMGMRREMLRASRRG